MKKKMIMGFFKVRSFAEHCRLPLRPVYSMAGLFLTILSFFSAIFSLFRIFAPKPIYREKNNWYNPYIESTTVLSDTSCMY